MFNLTQFHAITEIIQADFDGDAAQDLDQGEFKDFSDYIVAVVGGRAAFFLPDEAPYSLPGDGHEK